MASESRSPAVQRHEGVRRVVVDLLDTGQEGESVRRRSLLLSNGARFSPDGQWIAYASRDQGEKMTIYVQPFPPTGSKFPLFVKGPNPTAHKVAWSPDGKELFYVPRIGEFEAVTITTTPTFAFGNAVRVPRPFQPGAPNERTCLRRHAKRQVRGSYATRTSGVFHARERGNPSCSQLDRRAEASGADELTSAIGPFLTIASTITPRKSRSGDEPPARLG